MIQALSPEYKRIRVAHLMKPDFGITDIHRMMSAIYAANFARLSSSKGIAGHGAAVLAVGRNHSDITCHCYECIGHVPKTCSLRAKNKQQQNQRKQQMESSSSRGDRIVIRVTAVRQAQTTPAAAQRRQVVFIP